MVKRDGTAHTVETQDGDTAVLSYAPLDPAAVEASCRSTKDGAVVSFVGYTRDEFQGRTVTRLTYESYVPLALRTLQQILVEARALPPPPAVAFPGLEDAKPCCGHDGHTAAHGPGQPVESATVQVSRIRVAHLLGESPPLTPSICISVASPHRREAFYVAEWVLEAVKRKAQVWKREWYAPEAIATGPNEFVGRDGEGPHGRGGRAHEQAKWKENFPPPSSTST
ncbi:hypothetical protein JCM10908_004003 [Rhodotorula pacifica]|uniref:molybdopterin synthase catalytic subunit n=1 Tax=Rhodotorula pacifica TaxID=1495444 RepID=UPI00316BDDA0